MIPDNRLLQGGGSTQHKPFFGSPSWCSKPDSFGIWTLERLQQPKWTPVKEFQRLCLAASGETCQPHSYHPKPLPGLVKSYPPKTLNP